MSVAEQLGLQDSSELLALAGHRWPGWLERDSRLGAAGDLQTLRQWLRRAGPDEADEVLHGLATLASVSGGDDVAAAGVLAWALLPGACSLAHRLRSVSPRIDEVVAAQLWLEVRTFRWRRRRRVAANILMNTRAGVLRECGVHSQMRRSDPVWSRTRPVDPYGGFWAGYAARNTAAEDSPAEELLDLLEWACDQKVITVADRALLLCLVAAADRAGTTRVHRGGAGLMANDVSAAVAAQQGISAVTVRRRARRSLRALTQACAHMSEAA
jgi:hypothetical protein